MRLTSAVVSRLTCGRSRRCLPVRSRACERRSRRYERAFQTSVLFFRPYLSTISFSSLMRAACHGWDGVSYFFLENFGSPIQPTSLLLVRLRGGVGARLRRFLVLDDADRQAGAAVGAGALTADLLTVLVADAAVAADLLETVQVVALLAFEVRAVEVQVLAGL